MSFMELNEWISTKDAADLLDVTHPTVPEFDPPGELTAKRPGLRALKVRGSEVLARLEPVAGRVAS